MRLEHYSLDALKRQILDIVRQHLDITEYRVFFFGSRVSGHGSDRSDIDVGIEGPGPIPASIMMDIREELEGIRTLYKIDIVDFRRLSSKFRAVAEQHTEIINDRRTPVARPWAPA